jgi:hypothetical protein
MHLVILDIRVNYIWMLQRVMEQRVDNVLAMLLPRSPLTNPIPMEDGGYQQVIYSLKLLA